MYNYRDVDQNKLEFIPVGHVDEFNEGERLFIEIDNKPIMLIKQNGEYYAIADVCSHDDGPVGEGAIEGHQIICPRHGARFDLRTGKVLTLPAFVDIPSYPVRVTGDQVEIGFPLES